MFWTESVPSTPSWKGGLSIIIRPAAGLLADTARSSPAGRPALDWEALVKRGRPRSPSSRRPGVQLKLIGFCPRNLSGARGPSPPAPPEAEAYLVIRPREKSAGDQSLGGWCILILPRQGTLKRFKCAFEGFEGTLSKEYSQCPCSSNCNLRVLRVDGPRNIHSAPAHRTVI